MVAFLYNIIIFPLVQVIELTYLFIYRLSSNNLGIALCGLSLGITVITFPLYMKAEFWQTAERNIQQKMSAKIKKIKSVFRGDERYMLLSTFYRQNNYHPVYALRSSIGIAIQIPFFIAAWSFISGLNILNGYSFIGITDLGKPDGLLHLHAIPVNILPIIMTTVNVISGVVYAKNFTIREKSQLYFMAALFFILLYNSPAGLVLYWTFNNFFSLIKNIIQRYNVSSRKIYWMLLTCAVLIDIYILFIHDGRLLKRLIIFISSIIIFLIPILKTKFLLLSKQFMRSFVNPDQSKNTRFILSILILFVLTGLVIPSALIQSSPVEFSYIESGKSPFPFLFNVLLQSFGLFLFWPMCLYFFFSKNARHYFSIFFTIFSLFALANTFLVFEGFGFLTNSFVFSEPKPLYQIITQIIVNILILFILLVFVIYMYKHSFLKPILTISLCALIIYGSINVFKIQTAFNILAKEHNLSIRQSDKIEPFFNITNNGNNVMFIMLDAGISGFIPEIFSEKPEIKTAFSGFTYYPNCVSFGGHTYIGAAPLYGGYEYAPFEVNRRNTISLIEKQREAYLMLPRLFLDNSWSVTINDPPSDNYVYSNLSWFREYPEIKVDNLCGKYTSVWLGDHPDVSGLNITGRINNNLIRFSFFKISLLIIRNFIYDNAHWLSINDLYKNEIASGLTSTIIDNYAFMEYLPNLTAFSSVKENNFISLYSNITHNGAYLQFPDYILSSNVTNRGNGKFADDSTYHVNMAAFLLLGKYFNYLKQNNVYDNTRIIIASDHGKGGNRTEKDEYEGNITLPNGHPLRYYHSILLFKDFNKKGEINIDNKLMSNADAPLFAVKDIIKKPINLFTGLPLVSQKENGLTITTVRAFGSRTHGKYEYKINSDQWLHVKDNIFDPNNWEKAVK